MLYANICTNEVKKIRELKTTSNGKDSGKSGGKSVGSVGDTSKHAAFHQAISKYKISKVSFCFSLCCTLLTFVPIF